MVDTWYFIRGLIAKITGILFFHTLLWLCFQENDVIEMRASWHQEYVLIYRMVVLNAKGREKNSCLKGSGLRCSLHINTDEFSSRTQASQSRWQGMNLQINIGVSDYGANIRYLVNTQEYCTVNQDLTRDVLLYTLTCICTRVDHTCELNVSRKSKYAARGDWNELLACAV